MDYDQILDVIKSAGIPADSILELNGDIVALGLKLRRSAAGWEFKFGLREGVLDSPGELFQLAQEADASARDAVRWSDAAISNIAAAAGIAAAVHEVASRGDLVTASRLINVVTSFAGQAMEPACLLQKAPSNGERAKPKFNATVWRIENIKGMAHKAAVRIGMAMSAIPEEEAEKKAAASTAAAELAAHIAETLRLLIEAERESWRPAWRRYNY